MTDSIMNLLVAFTALLVPVVGLWLVVKLDEAVDRASRRDAVTRQRMAYLDSAQYWQDIAQLEAHIQELDTRE